ncbi:MAG: hypothetical protein Q9168_002821 [Polycauliona sp. 1 TL-2023]
MPPKRKASAGANSSRPSKKAASGTETPQSNRSASDDYSDEGEGADEYEAENINKAHKTFSAGSTRSTDKAAGRKADRTRTVNGFTDLSHLDLKPDHENRPLWIDTRKKRITLETFSTLAQKASEFLTTIAEPLSRPSYFHEYKMSLHSLYAAVSTGMTAKDIFYGLNLLSKTPIPPDVKHYINTSTRAYGKVRLVLKETRYFLEATEYDLLQQLLQDEVIGASTIGSGGAIVTEKADKPGAIIIPGTTDAAGVTQPAGNEEAQYQTANSQDALDKDAWMMQALREEDDDDDDEKRLAHSVEIPRANVEAVQRRCNDIKYPILEEYDFNNDKTNPNLNIDLKSSAKIRDYQEKSLRRMFGNNRARSGIIVLPCGAGKTLVGITAACTVKKGVIILCTSSMSVVQWRNEFLKWSNISPEDIAIFTSDHKERFRNSTGIVVSTYSMVTQTRARSHDAQKMMEFLKKLEWGLMILDEVHVVPASIFRKVGTAISTHCKLGLTATLLREDDKIGDLNFLIGPKLYEANWMELADQGHIAKVQCAEVWCPMTTEFFQEYLHETSRKRALLYIMNPRKFQACQFLIDYHEKRGDKIIVFSDNVYALQSYAKKLQKFFIYGGTSQAERLRVLENFQHSDRVNTIFLSKIGDTSLDLPEATCLIQISSHYGSRRQEAQRLGRILRAKRRNDEGFNAFFYSLVSKDTQEMYYSSKRQAFLVDQGYAFKVITHLQGIEQLPGLAFTSGTERRELLAEVMLQNETTADVEKIDDDLFGARSSAARGSGGGVLGKGAKRTAGMLAELSGGRDMAYIEYNKSRNKELKGKHNPLFKKFNREAEKRKKERRQAEAE